MNAEHHKATINERKSEIYGGKEREEGDKEREGEQRSHRIGQLH